MRGASFYTCNGTGTGTVPVPYGREKCFVKACWD